MHATHASAGGKQATLAWQSWQLRQQLLAPCKLNKQESESSASPTRKASFASCSKGGHACQTCNEMSICYFPHELPIGVTLGASSEAKVPPVPGPSLSAAPYLSPLHLLPDTPSVLPHMSGGGNDE